MTAVLHPGPRRRGTASAGRGGGPFECPPNGNTGGNMTNPTIRFRTRTITPHWFRVTHPASRLSEIRARLVDLFGQPDRVRGRWFFEHGERFGNGILLMWGSIVGSGADEMGDTDGICCVDVPGSALDGMDGLDRITFCVDFSLGGRVTRLDLAVDAHHEDGVGLIDAAIASATGGELVGSRTWEPRIKFKSGEIVAYGVNFGQRGKDGSGRYIRVYDKGLEQGDAPLGQHERFEVEFTKDCASEVAADVFSCSSGWEERAWNRVNGAIGFYEDRPSAYGHRDRRRMVGWWAEWTTGSSPVTTVPRRQETTLERHTRWLVNTVMPTTARLAKEIKVSFTDALYHLCGPEIKPRADDKYMRSMLEEWRAIMQSRPWVAAT